MGKLVDSFDWYFVCNVPYSESGKLRQDKKVSVNIPNTAVGSIECKIAYIGAKEGDFIPVVLKCNIMNRDVANLRIEDIEIITDQYTGIRKIELNGECQYYAYAEDKNGTKGKNN